MLRIKPNYLLETSKKKNRVKKQEATINDEYLKALKLEDNQSPVSWNLKSRAKILGHEYALQYFQSYDYRERKRELKNMTDYEKDIKASRHYKEDPKTGEYFSPG